MAVKIQPQSKYRNRSYNGYASKHEAEIAANLHALERFGVISDLKEQVRYKLVPAQTGTIRNEKGITYVADFQYWDKQGVIHVVDAKGFRTKEYVIKRKLMKHKFGIEIEEL